MERYLGACVFDYPRQMRLTISSTGFQNKTDIDDLTPYIDRSTRPCLLLFTAEHRWSPTVRLLTARYGDRVHKAQGDVDGVAERLRSDPNSIVCGMMRYWTGLDVNALGLVVIDKVPYEPDFYPRRSFMNELRLGNLWNNDYIERCNAKLVQGLGRLIRNAESRGRVAYIRDSRAWHPK